MYDATDWRYVIERNPEPDQPSDLYFVDVLEIDADGKDTGKVLDRFTTDDPGAAVEAAREVQAVPDLETRWNMQAEREARERGGWF